MQHLNETQRYTIYRMRKDKKTQAEIARAIGVSQATVSKEMKGVQWGEMYNKHRDDPYKESELRARVRELMKDSDVKNKSGIYWYVMDGDERHLDIRAFDNNMKREVYERQNGICPICGNHFEIEQMEADHIKPWCDGGHTVAANCQMLCRECNRRKSGK